MPGNLSGRFICGFVSGILFIDMVSWLDSLGVFGVVAIGHIDLLKVSLCLFYYTISYVTISTIFKE